jgi:hypothetical protein
MYQVLDSPAYAAPALWKRNPENNELPKLHYLTDVL